MKNNYSILAIAVSSLLMGCSDSDSDSAPETFTISGVVLDDIYQANAEVCIDFEGLDNTCDSSYSAMTDENGRFEFEVNTEEKERLSEAKITAKISNANGSNNYTAQANTDSIKYQSLMIGFEEQEVVVSPFTTQVVNEIALDTTNLINEASYKKSSNTVVGKQNLDSADNLFEDYLLASDQDVSDRATIAKQDMEKANEIKQEILNDINDNPDSPYADWDTIEVIVSNFWQHSHHNHEFTHRVEHLVYATRINSQGQEEDRKEGIQWYVEEYQDGLGLPLQNWSEERTWISGNTVQVHAFWEFDYDQDGLFLFKGEKGAEYQYQINESGYEQYSGYETYNEGNPADEGAQDRGDREWVENCPIVEELDKIGTGDVLDTCVDFVEYRDVNTAEIKKGLQTTDNMTEWQAPIGTPVDVQNDNQDYYEERTQEWMDDESNSYTTKHDWNALHYHDPDIAHPEPFNEIKIEGVDENGESFSDHSTPYWDNMLSPTNDLGLRGIQIYNQVNPFSWKSTSNVFLQERYTQHLDGSETYVSTTLRFEGGDQELYYVDASGKPEIWSETNIEWDEESQVLDAKIKIYDKDNLDLEPVVKHFLLDNYAQYGDAIFADMKIDGYPGNVNRLAFTSDIFRESVIWNVSVESEHVELQQVADFIFKSGESFSFKGYAQDYDMNNHPFSTCGEAVHGGIQNLLQFEKGGDIYISIRCDDGTGGSWVNETYTLQIDAIDTTGNFVATLKQWAHGSNILDADPLATATVTFQRAN
ncbi:hypothetical protein [Vibrio superstes]|uniref:Lipoprotein n=1 Tax=Vibrio superstes NBRC 103154 TaxID=1219062 RepID=A0A511QKR7_9VIBR|nr:hypothetical protein [Vibrio superstes]GEM77918.1 hypothetical protein VSU01S_01630 [Vibrio superstes NBRC 103154]